MKVDLIETRSFAVPRSRIGHWAEQLGFPNELEIDPTRRAERSITSESSGVTVENGQTERPNADESAADQVVPDQQQQVGTEQSESEEGPHSGPLFGSMSTTGSKLFRKS